MLGYNIARRSLPFRRCVYYVLGALATFGARYVMESKSGAAYDFSTSAGSASTTATSALTIGPITVKHPRATPFLIKIDRISCRVNPRSFLEIKKKKPDGG